MPAVGPYRRRNSYLQCCQIAQDGFDDGMLKATATACQLRFTPLQAACATTFVPDVPVEETVYEASSPLLTTCAGRRRNARCGAITSRKQVLHYLVHIHDGSTIRAVAMQQDSLMQAVRCLQGRLPYHSPNFKPATNPGWPGHPPKEEHQTKAARLSAASTQWLLKPSFYFWLLVSGFLFTLD